MSLTDVMGKSEKSKFSSITQFDASSAQTLGKGGFGSVNSMKCNEDGKFYAVKSVNIAIIMHLVDESETGKMKKMIFDEARLLRELDHENIVKVHGSFLEGDENSGTFYIVMEFCAGGSLKQFIRSAEEDFEETQILDWSSQIINGLNYLHSKKILHRDIKADNILLDASHQWIRIGDFGISKASQNTVLSARTAIGTKTHMPPEVLKGESYEWQSDVWSLGVVIFNLCARRLPFEAGAEAVLTAAIINDNVPIPTIPEKYSTQLRQVLQSKILVRDPEKRATAKELSAIQPFLYHVRQCETTLALKKENEMLLQQMQTSVRQPLKTIAAEQQMIDDLQRELEALKQKADRFAIDNERLLTQNKELQQQLVKSNMPAPIVAKGKIKPDVKLVNAAEKGDLYEVIRFLAAGADVNESRSGYGSTALMKAAWNGHDKVVCQLLANNADVNGNNKDGTTALMEAARNGQDAIVSLLLANKADVNSSGKDGETALMKAVTSGHENIVSRLIANGALVNHQYNDGGTPLMKAVSLGHDNIFSQLLANKADVDARDNSGLTALILASYKGDENIVSQLLASTPNVNSKSERGETALTEAAQKGHEKIVCLLLANAAEINGKGQYGETALMKAADNGHCKIVSLLLANNAEVNNPNNFGETALMLAASSGYDEIVNLLLGKKAEVNGHEKYDGETALIMAASHGHSNVVKQLLANNAEVDSQDNDGKTALMKAVKYGHDDVVNQLLEKNADVHLKNKRGDTALKLAGKRSAIRDMLIANGAS